LAISHLLFGWRPKRRLPGARSAKHHSLPRPTCVMRPSSGDACVSTDVPSACQSEQVADCETSLTAEHLSRRRAATAAAWNLTDEFAVVGAGEALPIPGRYDRTYPFRSHSEYFYLTDRERPGGVLAFDPNEGWFEFLAPVTRDELVWSGTEEAQAGVPDGAHDVSELPRWLGERRGRSYGCLGAAVPGVSSDARLEDD